MYTSFFGLKEKPFSITPDPRYLFMSERHAEALAHLMYGVNEAGGFVQLTGDIGTGKTTLVRSMLEKMPQHADVAVILNPRVSPLELLLSICQELAIEVPDSATSSIKILVDLLNQKLLAAHALGRRVIVIIDEAQNLSPETLEQVRLLTNLETASTKLMQIILIGQPELRDVLDHSGLKQLAQRITGRYHLAPLTRDESIAYARHRLKVAGATGEIFTDRALYEAHRVTEGVPRLINVVCDRALLGAYTEDQHRIDARMVRRAASEVFGKPVASRWIAWAGASAAVIAIAVLAFGVAQLWPNSTSQADAKAAPVVAPVVTNTVEAPKPAPVKTVASLFAGANLIDTTTVALRNLLAIWDIPFSNDAGKPCEQALDHGFECVYQKGSWGQLRILNRPVVLTLTDDEGRSHQALLSALTDDTARIALGDEAVEVSMSDLSRYWLGEYLLLWKPQTTGQRSLAVGARGAQVKWLRQGLDKLQSPAATSSSPASDVYDDQLAKRVEEFQRQHRLTVDGIAGIQTQIALDSEVDAPSTPRLVSNAQIETTAAVLNGGIAK